MKYPHTVSLACALIGSLGIITTPATAQEVTNAPAAKWDSSAAAGLTLTSGNSDTLVFTTSLLANRRGTPNEWSLGADASYGENDDIKNQETLHGFVQYNRLFSDRFYGYGRFDALHDDIADVDYRLTLSPGAGYYFIKNDRMLLSAEAGPGFVYEKQGGEEQGYLTLRVAEKFEYKLNDRAKIWQSLEVLPQVDRLENTIFIAEIGVETALTEKFSLRAYIQDTYDNEPAAGREKNDLKLVTALAYKF